MTTIRQLIQTSPTRANELFAKLVDTSETAVKTREKLFAELKAELELLASLEEHHLFPVLRKHKDLKDLVREALNDNKETRKLLIELDHTPKDSEEFGMRVAELRRVFQQHVRDEKKELLPAVLKALTDEQADALVEKIEAEKAEIEDAKRAEAEERRAEARREREKAEAEQARLQAAQRAATEARRAAARREREEDEHVQQAEEAVVSTAWAAPKSAELATGSAHEVVRNGLNTAAELSQSTTGDIEQLFEASGQRAQHLTDRILQSVQAFAPSSTRVARGIQDASDEYLNMVQRRMRTNLDGMNAVMRCRTLSEILAAQSSLFRENIELTLENSRRFAEVSARLLDNGARTATAPSQSAEDRVA